MLGNALLMKLNGFNIQNISKRRGRQNIFNEKDSFLDNQVKVLFPSQQQRGISAVAPVVPQGIQSIPNNDFVEGQGASQIQPEPENEIPVSELRKMLRQKFFKGPEKNIKEKQLPGQTTEAQIKKQIGENQESIGTKTTQEALRGERKDGVQSNDRVNDDEEEKEEKEEEEEEEEEFTTPEPISIGKRFGIF